jgi:hypothetical protein
MASYVEFIKTDAPPAVKLLSENSVPDQNVQVSKEAEKDDQVKKLEKKLAFLKNIKKGIKKDKLAPADPQSKKRDKKKWNSCFKLVKIEAPHQITLAGRKRFSVKIYYLDESSKKKSKTVRFGDKNVQEYIDNKDLLKKKSVVSRLQNINDPFNKSFWRLNLLNNKESLLDSYTDMIKQLGLY